MNGSSEHPGRDIPTPLAPEAGPNSATAEHFYPSAAFARLARIESRSFWFQARNRILLSTLRHVAAGRSLRYAEFGCGTGFVLEAVSRAFPDWSVHGYDIHAAAIAFSRSRAPRCTLHEADIHQLLPGAHFDVIGAFDVLEHLDDDVGALRRIHGQLTPGGHVVLTVPQHQSLWSPYDEAARHRRRYQRAEMHARLEQAGFTVTFLSSFVSVLWPALWWRRRKLRALEPRMAADLSQEDLTPSPWLHLLGSAAMKPDEWAAKLRIPLPWGGSLLAVGVRN